jgi:hypothetical protein
VTPDESKRIAEELAREISARFAYAAAHPGNRDAVWEAATDGALRDILRALSRVRPSRIEAAERAVVDAAMRGETIGDTRRTAAWLREMREACSRLRDLRAAAGAEECSFVQSVYSCGPQNHPPSKIEKVRCVLPRGHEGEHEGELGLWRWRGEG